MFYKKLVVFFTFVNLNSKLSEQTFKIIYYSDVKFKGKIQMGKVICGLFDYLPQIMEI